MEEWGIFRDWIRGAVRGSIETSERKCAERETNKGNSKEWSENQSQRRQRDISEQFCVQHFAVQGWQYSDDVHAISHETRTSRRLVYHLLFMKKEWRESPDWRTVRRTDSRTDGQSDRRTIGQMDNRTDGQMNGFVFQKRNRLNKTWWLRKAERKEKNGKKEEKNEKKALKSGIWPRRQRQENEWAKWEIGEVYWQLRSRLPWLSWRDLKKFFVGTWPLTKLCWFSKEVRPVKHHVGQERNERNKGSLLTTKIASSVAFLTTGRQNRLQVEVEWSDQPWVDIRLILLAHWAWSLLNTSTENWKSFLEQFYK